MVVVIALMIVGWILGVIAALLVSGEAGGGASS
jgi:uncharacterized membrane protein YeaQ/YmgE (transglycosylase-associated protein family)